MEEAKKQWDREVERKVLEETEKVKKVMTMKKNQSINLVRLCWQSNKKSVSQTAIHSFIHSFIHLFIRPFIPSFSQSVSLIQGKPTNEGWTGVIGKLKSVKHGLDNPQNAGNCASESRIPKTFSGDSVSPRMLLFVPPKFRKLHFRE